MAEDAANTTEKVPLYCPRGFHKVTVDSNGRAKLPSAYKRYVETRPDPTLFFTNILGGPKIFTNGSFEKLLATLDDNQQDDFAEYADVRGENLEPDGQGRITFPADKRKGLGLENCTVWFRYHKDVIIIYSDAQHEEIMRNADANEEALNIRARQGGFRL